MLEKNVKFPMLRLMSKWKDLKHYQLRVILNFILDDDSKYFDRFFDAIDRPEDEKKEEEEDQFSIEELKWNLFLVK